MDSIAFLFISLVVLAFSWIFSAFVRLWILSWRCDIKFDIGIPLFGSHWREMLNIESFHETLKHLYYKYPSERFVVLQGVGGIPEYLIRDPELVRQIAIRDFSSFVNRIGDVHSKTDPIIGNELTNLKTDDWRRIRNIISPLLSGQKLKQIVIPSLDECKRDLIAYLNTNVEICGKNELIVDMMEFSTRSSIDGFGQIAFGVKLDSLRSIGNEYGFFECSQSIQRHSDSLNKLTYYGIIFFPRLMKFLFGKTLISSIDHEFFTKSCHDIAKNRNIHQMNRADYIQLLQTLYDEKAIQSIYHFDEFVSHF